MIVLEIDVVRSVGTRAAARLANSKASVVRAIFGWMLLWVKMLRGPTGDSRCVSAAAHECDGISDYAAGLLDAYEVGASPRCLLEFWGVL